MNPNDALTAPPYFQIHIFYGLCLCNAGSKRLVQAVDLIGVRSLLGDYLPVQIHLLFVGGKLIGGEFAFQFPKQSSGDGAQLLSDPAGLFAAAWMMAEVTVVFCKVLG